MARILTFLISLSPQDLLTDFGQLSFIRRVNGLENKLVDYNNTSSTQIDIVIVKNVERLRAVRFCGSDT
jgi:hypothetical protein